MGQGLRAGPYELLTRLSGGGMGEVFVARRTGAGQFEKDVALKLLLPHLVDDAEFVERFFDEARLAARMNHPNIIHIFDVGVADGRPYLAMALVEGVSLGALFKALREKRVLMPLPLVRLVATGLLEALSYAHALAGSDGKPLEVVHRDVSPSNVMLSTAGAVLLTDFGIAKAAINLHFTRPGSLKGKAAYIAPEQASSGPVSARTDVFSAATLLYEALTGVSPFKRTTDLETLDAVKGATPPPVERARPEVGPQMVAALAKAHQKDPSLRFASARAFREAFVDGPVASAPELAEFVARHCGELLGAGKGASSSQGTSSLPARTPGTSSLPQLTPTDPHPAARPRWPWAAGLAAVLALGAAGWFAFAPAREEKPVVAEAPVAPPVTPPPMTPEPKPPPPVAPLEVPPARETPPEEAHDLTRVEPPPSRRDVRRNKKPRAERPEPPPPLENPELKVGYLTADAEPWAKVLLDGKELDQTPLSRFPVPVGKHTVLFQTKDGRVEKRPVVVEEGKVVTLRVDFGP